MTGSHKQGHGRDHRHDHRQIYTSEHAELALSPENSRLAELDGGEGTPERAPGKRRGKSTGKKKG